MGAVQQIFTSQRIAGGGSGTSPGTSNIIAWYDFADATDADGNTYPLSEQNTPTYTAGPPSFGSSTDGTPGAFWRQNSLDIPTNTADDWSLVIRFRAQTGIASGDLVITGNGGRTAVEYNTTVGTGIRGKIGTNTSVNSAVVPTTNTWYTVVVTRNNTSGVSSISVNGGTFVTASTTEGHNTGDFVFGGNTTTATNPVDIDFVGIWNKVLTQDNATWLYNSDGTRTYAEL